MILIVIYNRNTLHFTALIVAWVLRIYTSVFDILQSVDSHGKKNATFLIRGIVVTKLNALYSHSSIKHADMQLNRLRQSQRKRRKNRQKRRQ